jgi:hypothetical protein
MASKTAVSKWWSDLSETDRAGYESGFSNPNKPTAKEIAAAYDHANDSDSGGAGQTVNAGELVAKAHEAVANAAARKRAQDEKSAEMADDQRDRAVTAQAQDEADKAEAGNPVISIPDLDPKVPLTKEEQDAVAKAREAIATMADPNAPPITEEAQDRLDEAQKLPPASKTAPIATPGASATNPALARNDVDPMKTPPFGVGQSATLQG